MVGCVCVCFFFFFLYYFLPVNIIIQFSGDFNIDCTIAHCIWLHYIEVIYLYVYFLTFWHELVSWLGIVQYSNNTMVHTKFPFHR